MTDADDERLLAGLSRGDEQAFAAVYDRFGAALFRVARALLGSHQTAEDCVQEVFVGLVRARQTLPRVKNLQAYLFASLRHAIARHSELARRLPTRTLDEHMDLPDSARTGQAAGALDEALQRLPAEQRDIVVLKVGGGLTFAEIAATLNIPANTAASRYRYALAKLRETLQEDRHA